MSNYAQNFNNYFENMLGETANIRCNSLVYFQILVLLENLPYYDKSNNITKMEKITKHNLEKYIVLSNDNSSVYFHTPKKTLLYLIKSENKNNLKNKKEYISFYKDKNFIESDIASPFGNGVILNDFETFIKKIGHAIESI